MQLLILTYIVKEMKGVVRTLQQFKVRMKSIAHTPK